jgi:hypothetical protein
VAWASAVKVSLSYKTSSAITVKVTFVIAKVALSDIAVMICIKTSNEHVHTLFSRLRLSEL